MHGNNCSRRQHREGRGSYYPPISAAQASSGNDVWHGLVATFLSDIVGLCFSASLLLLPFAGAEARLLEPLSTDVKREQYERAVRQHTPRSNLPSEGEAEVMLQLPRELFTDDAWEGMKT